MVNVFYVEKKKGFDVEANNLLEDFKNNLFVKNLNAVRVLNKYTFKGESLNGVEKIIQEPPVDNLYTEKILLKTNELAFAVEYLPGQYDQRADATSECFAILNNGKKIETKSSKIIILEGNIDEDELNKIKKYYINLVDSREVDPFECKFDIKHSIPESVDILDGFIDFNNKELENFHKTNALAMSIEDIKLVKEYFKGEKRNPSITEIKVIDTYWSDHCRHTTFQTNIENVEIEGGVFTKTIEETFDKYKKVRNFVYENKKKAMTLMDIAVISMKEMRKRGVLDDLDLSDEINACSINVNVETDNGFEEYLVMFKNETHNHPTEIEPFGGAATCLGGAIRDPLSGRTYVYQAMRVTGSADPTVSIEETLEGKLPQRKITLGAAHGYSSYGNQIGLATGEVREIYHEGYMAKRMEIGAVIGAAPKENVIRETPILGDVIILLGGRTGRDGCGGATGSSKEHSSESIELCGAEVQKGNAPTERKIQRLFRNKNLTTLIKRCNDFGAGGVSVAIGELCDSLDINLDLVPKKYAGLDGTELAISESQERMAVVVRQEDAEKFIALSRSENLEATVVAKVTDSGRMRMFWNDKVIVDLKREFLDTNGAEQFTNIFVEAPKENGNYFKKEKIEGFKENFIRTIKDINVSSQKGLVERFDGTIGTGSILMPFGGKYQLTPAEGMACKIPVLNSYSKDCTVMTSGFNPYISSWSPYHGAYYSIIEAVTKIVTMGASFESVRLTLQEYFEKLGNEPKRWGKPFSALLGALKAQLDLGLPAIGGKDSMSGSFGELDVPPTLVAFAVAVEKNKNIKSPEFKEVGSNIVLLKAERNNDELLNMEKFKKNLKLVSDLNKEGKILSMMSIKNGGVCEALTKMCIGNKIGASISDNIQEDEIFEAAYGSILLEVDKNIDLGKLEYKVIGETVKEEKISLLNEVFYIDDLINKWESKLSDVFKIRTINDNSEVKNVNFKLSEKKKSRFKFDKPRVLIPIFPGTNCEYDSKKAFERAGAIVKDLVFKNLDKESLENSISELEKEIKKSQIIMIPGGFSAGDEPDGSAKFIVNVFRNKRIKEAVTDLLENRDGLILGICNGFQALIKLGLVPYGKIIDVDETMPTLTYNNIGRHMSSIVSTKITSNLSPWLADVEVAKTYNVPISHGEGKFIASEEVLNKLIENGQVATQYVDLNGNASMDMPYNPNGSIMGIEGITSPDGRVFGKMGHSERIGDDLYKNIQGEFDQKIFEAGVNYYK